uniref:Large ribosomal subunit protein mL54 n=1 Tax=Chloropicon primus TaxID=1764295 RepID=A0A7S2X0T2_9CHLO|mmetsp:Transcript_5220/g.15687  ORF Transcript_5220/g.15687 Transcript_5220/m.15687 type:complete len:130 (+) Transcript_5220:748-1137(+)
MTGSTFLRLAAYHRGVLPGLAPHTRFLCSPSSSSAAEEADDDGKQIGQPVQGINYKKGGTDPKILPDGEYPEWLWTMIDPKPTLSELDRKLRPIINKEINGIGELRQLMNDHEDEVSRFIRSFLGTGRR